MTMNKTLNFSQTLCIVEWPFSAYIFIKFVLNALKILYRWLLQKILQCIYKFRKDCEKNYIFLTSFTKIIGKSFSHTE